MQETRVTARLPRLDVEIIRQQAADADGETVCIRLHARPTFAAWGRLLLQDLAPGAALTAWIHPFSGPFSGPLFAPYFAPYLAQVRAPLDAWTAMLTTLWQPWLAPLLSGAEGRDDVEVLPPDPDVRPVAAADARSRTSRNTHR
jgi:hypothetical protein